MCAALYDAIVPPPHFHPLRYLKMARRALSSGVWPLLSFLCPDLEHVEFDPDGEPHPEACDWADINDHRIECVTDLPPEQWLPPDAQENIEIVRQLQQFDRGIIDASDTVYFITLNCTNHLEQMNIRVNQVHVTWFIQCAHESVCHGWYHSPPNAIAPSPIPFDTRPWILDRHGQWEEAVSFRPDAPPVPVDPLFSTMPETTQQAKKWVRAAGIVAVLMPCMPRQLIINGHRVSVTNDDPN
ncbi:hypothetical protein BC940DRAFT_357132 [Gongronella butleri]|nr:hypothetical protein BC940DRAFT_357132 [Gongronella butleri]